ncbi:hypothetical protein ACU8KH_06660 [Lachancea thermotolerans]
MPSSFLLLNLILSLGCSSTYSYRSGDLEQASLSLVFLIISEIVPSLSQNILVPLLFYDIATTRFHILYMVWKCHGIIKSLVGAIGSAYDS